MTKPPYRVPSMAEIAALPDNGLRVVSTFSGCGGSCLGFKMAGYRVLWASEFIPAAAAVYRANHPDTILDTQDIRKVQPEAILKAIGMKAGQLDAVEGSPPCSSFSTAGKREKHWGKAKRYSDTVQRVDDLFFEYARLVEGLQPRVFVAENVSRLVKGVAKGYFLEILAKLKACGYRVGCKVLDAQWLGVPQARQRTIFIGVREDLGREPVFPKPLPYRYSLREALPWIVRGKYGPAWKPADAPSATVSAGLAYNPATSHQGLELVEAKVIQGPQGNGWSAGNDLTDGPAPAVLATQTQTMLIEARLKGGTGAAFTEKGRAYDLATNAVAHFGRHYIPRQGVVYDIGASTGNIGLALKDTLIQRQARFFALEESREMADRYEGPPQLVVADAVSFDYQPFDFAVCFLVFMFLPVDTRGSFLRRLQGLTKPGGALVILDKVQMPPGYVGTAFSRLTLQQKLAVGATPDDILRKELSLAGYQRPVDPLMLPKLARTFFQVGEFVGWILEAPER